MIYTIDVSKVSTIGIFAPAAALNDQQKLESGVKYLEELGFKVKQANNLLDQVELFEDAGTFLPGDQQRRIDSMMQIWSDPEVDILLSMRGGYGSIQLLDQLDYTYLSKNPKPVLGYSDLTALFMALYTQAYDQKLELFHTPMLVELAEMNKATSASFIALLNQIDPEAYKNYQMKLNQGTKTLGGNLSLVASLVGTKYLPDFADSILFLEDCKELAYKIERMFYQLELAGVFHSIRELQLGTAFEAEYDYNFLESLSSKHGFKLIKDVPVGHGETNLSLVLG